MSGYEVHSQNIGLLVVDVQKGFLTPSTLHVPEIVQDIQNNHECVAVSRFVNLPGSPHRLFLNWHRLSPDSAECELAFRPVEHALVFDKSQYSCLTVEFMRWLHTKQLREIHICGIDTDVCVLTSAAAFFELSIKPVVLADACASSGGEKSHLAGLTVLERLIGRDNIWSGGLD